MADPAPPLRDLTALRGARDRMDREFDRPLDVEALAREACMSAGHFSRQFRRAYGEPPHRYLMTRRIERAMALLRRGDLPVTEVCLTVGFTSLGTFTTRFTQLVGRPPSAYRREAAGAWEGVAPCIARAASRPVRNEASARRDLRRSVRALAPSIHSAMFPQTDPGTFASINLASEELDALFERLEAADADVVQEPTDQPYGLRDCAVRDPAGTLVRIQQVGV